MSWRLGIQIRSCTANVLAFIVLNSNDNSLLSFLVKGSNHNKQEAEFENGGFTLETHQVFSVHDTPEEFKNGTISRQLGSVFEKHSGR